MLSNKSMYILVAFNLAICSAFYFTSSAQQDETAKTCHRPFLNATKNKCASIKTYQTQTAQQGWFSWLIGNSRSSQFHYLDLLELLESVGDSNQAEHSI